SGGKKIKVDKPLGLGGGLTVDIDA
nr:RecName: Full=Photosystem II 10 kDa polypeptide [Triticum aestivum]